MGQSSIDQYLYIIQDEARCLIEKVYICRYHKIQCYLIICIIQQFKLRQEMYRIATIPAYRSYMTSLLSLGQSYVILVLIAVLLIPFFLVYSTNGFYLNMEEKYQQFNMTFANAYYMSLNASKTQVEVTNLFTNNIDQQLFPSAIRISSQDYDDDGLADRFIFETEIIKANGNSLTEVFILLFFQVSSSYINTTGMLQYKFNGNNIANAYAVGGISLIQNAVINATQNNFNTQNVFYANRYILKDTLSSYYQSQVYIKEQCSYQIFNDDSEKALIRVDVNLQKQLRQFLNPGVFKQLEWSWSQYFPLMLVFLLVGYESLIFCFKHDLLDSKKKIHL